MGSREQHVLTLPPSLLFSFPCPPLCSHSHGREGVPDIFRTGNTYLTYFLHLGQPRVSTFIIVLFFPIFYVKAALALATKELELVKNIQGIF